MIWNTKKMTQRGYIEEARALLQHGGVATGLAAVALAQNTDSSDPIGFHVLSPQLTAGAEKVIAAIERGVSRQGLAAAVGRALDHPEVAAPPEFALTLAQSRPHLAGLASQLEPTHRNSIEQIFPDFAHQSPRDQGVTILACALCRTRDSVRALGQQLSSADAQRLYRSACLASVKTQPGLPSSLRRVLRRLAQQKA